MAADNAKNPLFKQSWWPKQLGRQQIYARPPPNSIDSDLVKKVEEALYIKLDL
ncbi:hypothetical protein CDL15_Pgr006736 [Punica granatum]|uniref:Uncharacterized protein n=1 Tax=Punica granatum TaxID=22663 RepID=A0A218X7Q3_PUNGR|nr:hypothetical protein CDL15_Pgr006736 [Punica granatum]PKI48041.1 hypothetical protein CRG98_031558 [Punica granatum]